MFKFLKKIFSNQGTASAVSETTATATPVANLPRQAERAGGGVEVAALSLRALLEKLPPDLKALVNQLPDPEATIVLPINAIMKQIAGGSVKMSFASLLRQAPPGTFRKAQIEEKQMVDVPLAEVFKTIDPKRLRLRAGQRSYNVPEEAAGIFGSNGQNRHLANSAATAAKTPDAVESVQQRVDLESKSASETAPVEAPKVLRMPGIPASAAPTTSGASAARSDVAAKPSHTELGGQIVLSLVELASGWPEGIRAELSVLSGDTIIVLQAFEVSAGLQKGKVTFPWSQIRASLRPSFSEKIAIADDYQLVLPLKVVAPAFLAATGATKRKTEPAVDRDIPNFFGPTAGQSAAIPAQPAAAPPTPEPIEVPESSTVPEIEFSIVREAPEVATDSTPLPESPAPPKELTLRDLFNQPDKSSWTPAELITHSCELPGIAGAVIALEEGLVVAQKLPPGFAAETFAAFMPQIFGRIERYTREMQLGDVDEVALQTAAGPCQLFRNGKVFFAAMGFTGEPIPAGLKLIPAELSRHNQ